MTKRGLLYTIYPVSYTHLDAVGDAALLRVAKGGVEAGVRHTDDHIGLHGVLLGQDVYKRQG